METCTQHGQRLYRQTAPNGKVYSYCRHCQEERRVLRQTSVSECGVPLCPCHRVPMRWMGRMPLGHWICSVKRQEGNRRKRSVRRARMLGVVSEPYSREEIYDRDGGRCRYCDELVGNDWHIAHLVALSRGGPDTRANVAVACPACNLADGEGRLPVQLHLVA